MLGAMRTRFVELAGPDAAERLTRYGRALAAAGADVRLLRSVEQRDLFLLLAAGGRAPDGANAPDGARLWAFEEIDRVEARA